MDTPIRDFVRRYGEENTLRLHMPGHKGTGPLGMEKWDITEISGADSLYEANGIIEKSEENASRLFGCPTFYSTEGSSQCIRAMLYLAVLQAKAQGKQPRIAAGRNVHKTFLSAAALLDLEVDWLYPEEQTAYLSCNLTGQMLDSCLSQCDTPPTAVYITSPDYLGNVLDVAQLADICHRRGVLLLVDNAHGAYLKFLPQSRHPMDLGADLCCDSAHKTLPVLTGGAYLHITADFSLLSQAKNALALFGSTSPSYLILQSLDAANPYLTGYPQKLQSFCEKVGQLKNRLTEMGWCQISQEPLKITLSPKPYGYTGTELADVLRKHGLECEFADPDFLVLMLTPAITRQDLEHLADLLNALPRRTGILTDPPRIGRPERVLSIREAILSPAETIPASESKGRVLAAPSVGCPPAVPILVCGERIDDDTIGCFAYYGITHCTVVNPVNLL